MQEAAGNLFWECSWCTNVGNEREVLVLTESEGLEGLRPMAIGLVERFVCVSCIAHFISVTQVQEGQAGSPTAAVY